nr:MAG TPA: hypothetical protein [Bacteriophage sp.]
MICYPFFVYLPSFNTTIPSLFSHNHHSLRTLQQQNVVFSFYM